ncbi:MAG: hypothetical protein KGM15_06450 [Pseudomonadota bacterium]|nr:hypothetical protein [Pseudomonadota bacterium]
MTGKGPTEMGFLIRSAIGLGCVYYAMFGQALRPGELAPAAQLCADAASASLTPDAGLRAPLAAAGCAEALTSQARRAAPQTAPVAKAKRPSGTLTADDLRDPWLGPGRLARKTGARG